MHSYRKTFVIVIAVTLAMLLCLPAIAQGPADLTTATPATSADPSAATPAATPDPAPPANPVPQYPMGGGAGDDWRVAISIYGWFPGVHGSAGVLGHNASIHQSFSDVFHTLKGIIPIAVEADKGRFVMPIDYLWMKLGIDNGIPENDFGQTSVNTHLTESIFTPKLGYPRHFIAALVGMYLVCVMVMICYTYADRFTRILGRSGTGILIRLSAFILLAIGAQIMSNGIRPEFPGLLGPIHDQVNRLSSEGQSRNHVAVCPAGGSVTRSVSLRQVANVGIPEEVNHV
jgi:hypothetical protein